MLVNKNDLELFHFMYFVNSLIEYKIPIYLSIADIFDKKKLDIALSYRHVKTDIQTFACFGYCDFLIKYLQKYEFIFLLCVKKSVT